MKLTIQHRIAKPIITLVNRVLSKMKLALVMQMVFIGRKREKYINSYDYIRFSSLELVAHEIYTRNILGNVAELGVYRGDFASKINVAFPDRKLYLFDTFEGFDSKDIETEDKEMFSKSNVNNFSDTNVDFVLKRMINRKNCIVKKGFFPDTAKDVEDKFSFVSIDCDLYDPILSGLRYFWKHLVGGGVYICA